jgi:NAD(P)-dependent dehydrogenase (short-subunit alcohol dehydrogenase family)
MFDQTLFAGQVALITGGCGGIGGAVARALQSHGARVFAADLAFSPPPGDSGVEFELLDVTNPNACSALAEKVAEKAGRIDILVNAAGVVSHGAASNISEAEWNRVIDINLKGTFFSCQSVMPIMKRQNYGRIINIGSVLGKNGGNPRPWLDPNEQERAGNVAYGITKAGVHALTAYLAKELASHGITVNAVAPGPISSAMTTSFPEILRNLIPVGRMGQAEEVADAILFLATRKSSFITGEVIDINGGLWND